ncbi:hypothetical protein [Cryobacterium sp. GrIS_2_6]|uniref:hypothetical protein n=1 Tax=Cryobacterium sp. GrIS_2_6 TaxID=3162785 RepID=UPI002E04F7B7|nr:hypothetical protein [Cryobacterium psychrotolerans]
MSKLIANVNGGSSDEYGTFKALNEAFTGQIFKGLDVIPNSTPNMTVSVNPGSGRIPTGTSPSDYYYMISHDTTAGESVTIATAAASPRIDYIVAYIDKSVTAAVSPVNNANNLLKFAAVAGTPAGSPVVPTTAQIQTAIGAANPYIILANVAVAASATTITTPNITDQRTLTVPVVRATATRTATVSMGYGTAVVVYRYGNLVIANMNTVCSSLPSLDSGAVAETMTLGYRPGGIMASAFLPAVSSVGNTTDLGWVISSSGAMTLSNRNAITGSTRIFGSAMWTTADA